MVRALLCLCLVGCFAPNAPTGAPCGEGAACPSGQLCFEGVCNTMSGQLPDDATVDPTPDSPGPDAPAVTVTLTFGDGDGAIEDTFLTSGDPETNHGIHKDLHVTGSDVDPILIWIDVTSIPSTATVVGARLRFVVIAATLPSGVSVDAFVMNEGWSEGSGDYEPGIANSTMRRADTAWSTAGALPPSRDNTRVARATAAADLGFGDELVIDLPAAVVAEWVASPGTNEGLALFADTGGIYCEFGSTEADNANRRPILEVDIIE